MGRNKRLPYETEGDIFATRLREVMESRGTNQTKLSAQIQAEFGTVIQRQTLSQYMNGQSHPDTERLTLLCNALGVSADYLIGLSNTQTTDGEIAAACAYVGLSEEATQKLHRICKCFPLRPKTAHPSAIVSKIVTHDAFDAFVVSLMSAMVLYATDKQPAEIDAETENAIQLVQRAGLRVLTSQELAEARVIEAKDTARRIIEDIFHQNFSAEQGD